MRPTTLAADDLAFDSHEVAARTSKLLNAWSKRNYGLMATFLSSRVAEETINKTAGLVRELYESMSLETFVLKRLDHNAAASCIVDAELTIDGETHQAAIRWIRETPPATPPCPTTTATGSSTSLGALQPDYPIVDRVTRDVGRSP